MIRRAILALALAAPAAADEAQWLAEDAAGSWTTIEQSASPDYDWVESEVVQIWADREDGAWLYQENAIIGADAEAGDLANKDQPYFQVVVHLQNAGRGEVFTTTYRVANREAARGAWRSPEDFDPVWLGAPSCAGKIARIGRGWWRGDAECANSYKGAVRVVSQSVRSPEGHVNWDRGFDAAGTLVWGPAGGGYIFKRKEEAEE
ncbi:MAG: chromophore lyase CpcT/CpeT [Pseudomonadota bacterium]